MPYPRLTAGADGGEGVSQGKDIAPAYNAVATGLEAAEAAATELTADVTALAEYVAANAAAIGVNATAIDAAEADIAGIKAKIGTDPEIIQAEAIHLAGLPQTAGAPEGFGDLASAVLKGVGINNDAVKSVDPVDFYDIASLCNFGDFMYGVSAFDTNVVVQINLKTHAKTNYGSALPITHIRNIKCLSDGSMIVEADGNTDVYRYYKTSDGGATWRLVLTQDILGVRMLTNRSMCEATINGSTVLLYGEYNINTSRTSGGANDRVRLLRSDDMGETWSEVTRWNTNGSRTDVRHTHAVLQSPSGRIFVNTGDSNSESCMYSWDGVSPWPVNVLPADTVQTAGLRSVSGSQQTRAIDMLFKDGAVWYIPDLGSGQLSSHRQMGVWKINEDLDPSSFVKVSAVMTNQFGVAGWLGCTADNGEFVWLGGVTNPRAGGKYAPIVLGNKAWTDFKTVGALRCDNSAVEVVPYNMFFYDGRVYVSCSRPSGKTPRATAVFEVSLNDFKGEFYTRYRPETVHPVYYVDPVNGSDANNGFSPRTAWRTFHYGLLANRMTYGARMQIMSDIDVTTTGSNGVPRMDANATPGDPAEPLVVSGGGATKTKITLNNASTSAMLVQLWGSAAQKVEFQDIELRNNRVDAGFMSANASAGGAGAHSLGFVRCLINTAVSGVRLQRVALSDNCPVRSYSSVFMFREGAEDMFDSLNTGGASYTFDGCLVSSGNIHTTYRGGANNSFYAVNTDFVGAFKQSLHVLSGSEFTSIYGLDVNFWNDYAPNSFAIVDAASVAWNGQFRRSAGNQPRGVAAAFDGYSRVEQNAIPVFNYADYVY